VVGAVVLDRETPGAEVVDVVRCAAALDRVGPVDRAGAVDRTEEVVAGLAAEPRRTRVVVVRGDAGVAALVGRTGAEDVAPSGIGVATESGVVGWPPSAACEIGTETGSWPEHPARTATHASASR